MDLKEIYRKSKGVLSHTERDFYLGFCSHADNDSGFCFPKISTVAEMIEVLPQSASRLYKKIVEKKFLEKVSGGYICLVGFNADAAKTKPDVKLPIPETKPDVKKTKPDVNVLPIGDEQKLNIVLSETKHSVNTTKPDVKLHIKEGTTHLTTQLTKEKTNSSELGGNASPSGESISPPTKPKRKPKDGDKRKDHPAIKMVHGLITRYPHKDLWDRIIREIGDSPDTEFFRASYEIWLSVNGNPMNLQKWLFDPAKTGKAPEIYGTRGEENNGRNQNKNRPTANQPDHRETLDETLRRIGVHPTPDL